MGERWNAARLIEALTNAGDGKRGLDRMLHELNTDCAAYEARIAELEAEAVTATQRIDSLAGRCEFQAEQIAELVVERDAARAELARVKADSLRVVKVKSENEINFGAFVRHIFRDGKFVRLEHWETEE